MTGDRLLHVPDAQVGVHGRHEIAGELETFALDGAETRELERDHVRPGSQIDNPILATAVADSCPHLLDQDRAGCVDRHAGQHGSGRVADDARNNRLGKGYGRQSDQPSKDGCNSYHSSHSYLHWDL